MLYLCRVGSAYTKVGFSDILRIPMGTFFISLLTFLATTAIGQTIEFLKKISPKIVYATTPATPIKLEGKTTYVGAYNLKILNTSRKNAEEITFQLRAGGASLRIDELHRRRLFYTNQQTLRDVLNFHSRI
jgi:hypothetical protein